MCLLLLSRANRGNTSGQSTGRVIITYERGSRTPTTQLGTVAHQEGFERLFKKFYCVASASRQRAWLGQSCPSCSVGVHADEGTDTTVRATQHGQDARATLVGETPTLRYDGILPS
ncbi:MAG: hypothetical protein NZ874_00840 [Fimbriimonadales bacterium]|nr:hypothetical protein [Fimbriimonadales bacterium]